MLKKILVLIEAGEDTALLLQHALQMALDNHAALQLVPLCQKKETAAGQKRLQKILRDSARQCQEKTIAYEIVSSSGLTFAESLPLAHGADLVMLAMAPRQLKVRQERHLVRLLIQSGAPIFLARQETSAAKPVLVAWSGAGGIGRTLRQHLHLLQRMKAQYLLFHQNEDPGKAQGMLDPAAALVQAHGATVETLALSGACEALIAEIEKTIHPHHIVMSTNPKKLHEKEQLSKRCRAILQKTSSSIFISL